MGKYTKLDPKVKRKWLKALRSQRYQKATQMLCRRPKRKGDNFGFCCLGVLVDVAVLDGVNVEWREPKTSCEIESALCAQNTKDPADSNYSTPPRVVRDWANLDDAAEKVLTGMNDQGRSHLVIADWIEKHL